MNAKRHMSEVPMIQRVAAYLAILVGYFFYCYNFVIIDYVRPYIVEAYDGISLSDTAQFYTWQSVGALIGALSCAWFATKFGKKSTLITITALNGGATIINMMFTDYTTWAAMRFIIGLSLGGYFSELFPAHLRSYGAALFHGGRILGMWAPMVLIFIQERTDLQTAMWGSPIVWILAGLLWLSLPETLKGGVFNKSKKAEAAKA